MNISEDLFVTTPSQETDTTYQPAWAPWRPEPILPAPAPATLQEQSDTTVKSKQKIKELLAHRHKLAHKQGYAEGHAAGYAVGLKKGTAEGHEKGYQTGYNTGLQAGHDEGRVKAEQAADQLATLSTQCANAFSQLETEVGQELIKLAMRIAEQVLHHTLDTRPDLILGVVDTLLRLETGQSAVLHLYVNSADHALVHDYLTGRPDASLWKVIADDTITRGGCKARTALGDIDATLEKRWQRVTAALNGSSE